MKKKDTSQSKEFDRDREFAVILENLQKDIKIIAEGHTMLDEKLTRNLGALDEKFTGKFDLLFGRMGQFDGRMDRIEGKMDRIEGRMDRVETAVLEIAKTTREIKESVADHTNRIAHLEGASAK